MQILLLLTAMTWILPALGVSSDDIAIDDDGNCYDKITNEYVPCNSRMVSPSIRQQVCEDPACGASVSGFDPWDELLENLPDTWSFAGGGATLGVLYVYGDGKVVEGVSVPVIKDKNGKTVVAAAQLGQGRIVMATHTTFAKDFTATNTDPNVLQLHNNIKMWLSKGNYRDSSDICTITSVSTTETCIGQNAKIVYQKRSSFDTSSVDDAMLSYVKNGGSLFFALTAWAFYQYTVPDFRKVSFAAIYHEAGILPSTRYGYPPFTTISTEEEKESYRKSNIAYLVDISTTPTITLENVYDHNVNLRLLAKSDAEVPEYVKKLFLEAYADMQSTYSSDIIVPDGNYVDNTGLNNFAMYLTDTIARHGIRGVLKVPGIDAFPYEMDDNASVLVAEKIITITSVRYQFYTTGLYHAAGTKLRLYVESSGEDYNKWKVRIGPCTDQLWSKSKVKRWPSIHIREYIINREHLIENDPYGGLIYLESPSSPSTITVRFQFVHEAPEFTLETLESEWNTIVDSPVPWVDVSGVYTTFSVPRTALAGTTYNVAKSAMEIWDDAFVNNFILRGSDHNAYKRQFFTADRQISFGYMHAGHPIMTQLDVADPTRKAYFLDLLWEHKWGHFHEIGHNMQRSWWTFPGTGIEVSVNWFSLYNMEKVVGFTPWDHPWLGIKHNTAAEFVAAVPIESRNAAYESMDAKNQLFIYAQLQYHFGWDCFTQVLAWYENSYNEGNRPSNNQGRRDAFVKQFSISTGYNLLPLFYFWGWKVSEPVTNEILAIDYLVPFMPDDKSLINPDGLTGARDEADRLATIFPNTVRTVNGTSCTSTTPPERPS